ncbi:MAG: J domain-containing protein [Halalkalicoccus sp.]|nr:J domain-containing protein [Halalkalicoccus sp.]
MVTLYDVLGVDPDAGPGEIRAAYRERVKRHHPDVDGGDAAAFRRLTTARDVLLDEDSRARYEALGHRRYARHHLGEEWPVEESSRAARRTRAKRSRAQPRRRRARRVVRDRSRHRRRSSGPADAAVALGTYRSVLVRAGVVLLALFVLAVVLSALSL